MPRRSDDDAPCSPRRGRCTARGRRIPADCVLAGTGSFGCLTGRTSRRRLSHALLRKDRASAARARPDKGATRSARGRSGRDVPEVTKLKHRGRGTRRPCHGRALRNKAEQWSTEFLPATDRPVGPIRRRNPPGGRRETFHALYMPPAARRTARRGWTPDAAADRMAILRHRFTRPHAARATRPRRSAQRAGPIRFGVPAQGSPARGASSRSCRACRPSRSGRTVCEPLAEPIRTPLSRPADARRRPTARRRCRRCRRCGRDRSARARSSSDRASRVKCRVRRLPC